MTKNGDRLRMIARGLRTLVPGRSHPLHLDLSTYAMQLDDMADQMDTFKAALAEMGVDVPGLTNPEKARPSITQQFERSVVRQ